MVSIAKILELGHVVYTMLLMTLHPEQGSNPPSVTDWEAAEKIRKELANEGKYIGWNSPLLPLEHAERDSEINPGASGEKGGFLFGGEVYPSAEDARRRRMVPEQQGIDAQDN